MPWYQNQTTGQVQWLDALTAPPGWGPATPQGIAGAIGQGAVGALDPRPRVQGVTDAIGSQFGYAQPPQAPPPSDPRDYPSYQGPPRAQPPAPAPAAASTPAATPPVAPKPGGTNYLAELQKYLSDQVDYRTSHMQTLREQLQSYQTPEGRAAFVKEFTDGYAALNKTISDAGGVVEPVPAGAPEAALTRRIQAINASIAQDEAAQKAAMNSLTVMATKQAPALLDAANAKVSQAVSAAQRAEMEQQQRQANPFGFTNLEQFNLEAEQSKLQLATLDKSLDLDKYMTADEIDKQYTIPRQQLIDRVNVAHNLMQQDDQRDTTQLENDRSIWQTLHQGALAQWSKQYDNDVTQRAQDISAANDMVGHAAAMARAMMPLVVPRAYAEAAFGANSPYAKMGGTPVDYSKVAAAPSYNELLNAPQRQWTQMMGTSGLPSQVQAPPFNPPSPPNSGAYLPQPSSQAMLQSFAASPSPQPMVPQGNSYALSQQMMAGLLGPPPSPSGGYGVNPYQPSPGIASAHPLTSEEMAIINMLQQEAQAPPSSGGEE